MWSKVTQKYLQAKPPSACLRLLGNRRLVAGPPITTISTLWLDDCWRFACLHAWRFLSSVRADLCTQTFEEATMASGCRAVSQSSTNPRDVMYSYHSQISESDGRQRKEAWDQPARCWSVLLIKRWYTVAHWITSNQHEMNHSFTIAHQNLMRLCTKSKSLQAHPPEPSLEPCWTWPGSAPKPPGIKTLAGEYSLIAKEKHS